MEEILIQTHQTTNQKTADFHMLWDIVVFAAVIIALFRCVEYFCKNIKIRLEEKESSILRFLPLFERITKGLILFFTAATFLQSYGYSMNSIIAGFGITGLAVGFAAKETIASVFGAITILADKSFKLDDCVIINDIEGVVEDINMRSTKIRALDNSLVIIPNNVVAASVIKNISKLKKRRIIETISITYDTADKKIRRAVEIIEEIFQNHPDIVAKDNFVFVEKLAHSSIDIKISAFLKTHDYLKYSKIKEEILLEILAKYRKEKIELAFPTQTVHVAK